MINTLINDFTNASKGDKFLVSFIALTAIALISGVTYSLANYLILAHQL